MHGITLSNSQKRKDGSKLDECKSHEPYVWEWAWTVLGIFLGKNSTRLRIGNIYVLVLTIWMGDDK